MAASATSFGAEVLQNLVSLDSSLRKLEADLQTCRDNVQQSVRLCISDSATEKRLRAMAILPPPPGVRFNLDEGCFFRQISGPAAPTFQPRLEFEEATLESPRGKVAGDSDLKLPMPTLNEGRQASRESGHAVNIVLESVSFPAANRGTSPVAAASVNHGGSSPLALRESSRQSTKEGTPNSPRLGGRPLVRRSESNLTDLSFMTSELKAAPQDSEPSGLGTLLVSLDSRDAHDSNDEPMTAIGSDGSIKRSGRLQNLMRKKTTCRSLVWTFLQNPDSSKAARNYAVFMNMYIFASLVVTTVFLNDLPDAYALGIEVLVEFTFLVELIVRFICTPSRRHFLHGPFNIIDIVAVVPLGVRLLVGLVWPEAYTDRYQPYFIGIVPLFRLLRVLRRFPKFVLLMDAFNLAAEALPVLLFTMTILHISFSALFFVTEPRSNVATMQTAMWFTIVTMTTLGYGDTTPVTGAGHVVASATVVCGLLYMALPIGLLGNVFQQVWQDRHTILVVSRVRAKLLEWGYEAVDIPVLFEMFDSDGDGELNLADFTRCMEEAGIGMGDDKLVELFEVFDDDGSGCIDDGEFVSYVFPEAFGEIYGMSASKWRHMKIATASREQEGRSGSNEFETQKTYESRQRRKLSNGLSRALSGENSARLGGTLLAVARMG
mmetsp:Transcript_6384/g.13953  ORF Transcript_6384/g.13953 Transcript_6384/m.13953 type:complete len:661 (-) Transcript_6384:110-2092(-)